MTVPLFLFTMLVAAPLLAAVGIGLMLTVADRGPLVAVGLPYVVVVGLAVAYSAAVEALA